MSKEEFERRLEELEQEIDELFFEAQSSQDEAAREKNESDYSFWVYRSNLLSVALDNVRKALKGGA